MSDAIESPQFRPEAHQQPDLRRPSAVPFLDVAYRVHTVSHEGLMLKAERKRQVDLEAVRGELAALSAPTPDVQAPSTDIQAPSFTDAAHALATLSDNPLEFF